MKKGPNLFSTSRLLQVAILALLVSSSFLGGIVQARDVDEDNPPVQLPQPRSSNTLATLWDYIVGNRPIFPWLQCFIKVGLLGVNITDFERYDVYFREDSVVILPEAGRYQGPENIQEYIQYGSAFANPFILSGPDEIPNVHFRQYNATTGQCEFTITGNGNYVANPEYTPQAGSVRLVAMGKIYFDFAENYVTQSALYYPPAFLDFYFGYFLNTPAVREYLCNVITGPSCNTQLTVPAMSTCVAELEALEPLDDPETRTFLGPSQGCRLVHGVFAETNPSHCPHIAFPPVGVADPSGRILCQESTLLESPPLQSLDFFDDRDFELLRRRSQRENVDPEIGFIYEPSESAA